MWPALPLPLPLSWLACPDPGSVSLGCQTRRPGCFSCWAPVFRLPQAYRALQSLLKPQGPRFQDDPQAGKARGQPILPKGGCSPGLRLARMTQQLFIWLFLFLTNPSLWVFSRGAKDCQGSQVHGGSQGLW